MRRVRVAMPRVRRHEALVAGVAAAVVAALVVLAIPLVEGRGGSSLLPPGKSVEVALAEFSPAHHAFGDRVQATLEIAVDRRRVDVGTVRPLISLAPYRVLSSARSVHVAGDTALVRYRLVLDCLKRACLAGIFGRRDISFAPTAVFYAGRDGKVRHLRASWPTLRVLTRVSPYDLASFPVALDAEPLAVGRPYRHDPRTLAWLAAAGSAALLLAAGALLAQPLLRRRKPVVEEPVEVKPDRLGLALDAVQGTLLPPPLDERPQALDRLARELEAAGEYELAARARLLAWRDEEIVGDRVEELLDSCRRAMAGSAP